MDEHKSLLFKIPLTFILLAIVVNTTIFCALFFYDDIPRFLNVILFYFAIPLIGMGLALAFVSIVLWRYTFSEYLLIPFAIIGITLWIGLMVGNAIIDTNQFAHVVMGKRLIDVSIEESLHGPVYNYYRFINASFNTKEYGVHKYFTSSKSGDNYVTTYHSHYIIPIVPTGWKKDTPVRFWLTNSMSSLKNDSTIQLPKAYQKTDAIQGIIVTDPYDNAKSKKALKTVIANNKIPVHKSPVFLEYVDSYERYVKRGKRALILYIAILNLLWLFIPHGITSFLLIKSVNDLTGDHL